MLRLRVQYTDKTRKKRAAGKESQQGKEETAHPKYFSHKSDSRGGLLEVTVEL
jgi:hypothetical protein